MVCTPALLFIRAFDCAPCNMVMGFFPQIVEKMKTDVVLRNLSINFVIGSLAVQDASMGVDWSTTPKSLRRAVGLWPTFVMIKKEQWDEAMKLIEAGQDDSIIDVLEDAEMMGYDNVDGKFVTKDLFYRFVFPFGVQKVPDQAGVTQTYKGLYEWILDAYVRVKLGKVPNFEEYVRDNTEVIEVIEVIETKEETTIDKPSFYIDC